MTQLVDREQSARDESAFATDGGPLTQEAGAMHELIAESRKVFETESTIARILTGIQAALQATLRRPDCLDGLKIDQGALQSWKVYVDPDHLFSLHVSHQPAGHSRGVHDHGELGWAVYGLLNGEVLQQLYRRLDDGSDVGKANLEAQPLITQRSGDATIVPVGWAHAPRNESGRDAWTVVIRSRDQSTVWRNRYDVASGRVYRMRSSGD